MKDILIITVNYRNTSVTEDFIHSLEKLHEFQRVQLVIVDSASTNATKEELETLLHNSSLHTQIIYSDQNTYYWGGVALAIKHLKLEFSIGPKWLIACNNDIVFSQRGFIKQLLALDPATNPVIAPTIKSLLSGKNLNPYMAKPIAKLEKIYLSLFYIHHISGYCMHIIRKYTKLIYRSIFKLKVNSAYKIYAPHGSFMIFSNHYFTRGGWIDDNFKMYGEEATVAEIAQRNNIPILFNPALEVLHNEHSTTANHSWKKWFTDSKEAYKYYKKAYLT